MQFDSLHCQPVFGAGISMFIVREISLDNHISAASNFRLVCLNSLCATEMAVGLYPLRELSCGS